jgi:hypothetical protein
MAPLKIEKQCLNKNSYPKELDVLSGGLEGFFVWKEIAHFEPIN